MASLTIRNLDEHIKQRLRIRAAEHGRSMEEEARAILRATVVDDAPPRDIAAAIRAHVGSKGTPDLPIPDRQPMRDAPTFD